MIKKIIACNLLLIAFCILFGTFAWCAPETIGSDLAKQFDNKYQDWLEARARWIQENPTASYLPVLPEEKAILQMGPKIIPFMIKKFEQEVKVPQWNGRFRADNLGIMRRLTAKHFRKEEWPDGKYADKKEELELYVKWWKEGRKETPQKLNALFAKLDQLPKNGNSTDSEDVLGRIRSLGLEIMPQVIQKIKGGDERFVAIARILIRFADGANNEEERTPVNVLEWWKANEDRMKFPDPLADTGRK